jgi:predicted RNA-binding protein with PIN domain
VALDRLIVVDGYNLILRAPTLKPGPDRTLRESREKLVNLLSWAVGSGDARFIVVFDGAAGGSRVDGSGRVEVRYSKPPENADALIRRIVEDQVERVERLTVVSSDLEVARHARAMGADIAMGDLFLASAVGPASVADSGDAAAPEDADKPTTLSKKELAEWAELFSRRGEKQGGDPDETAH